MDLFRVFINDVLVDAFDLRDAAGFRERPAVKAALDGKTITMTGWRDYKHPISGAWRGNEVHIRALSAEDKLETDLFVEAALSSWPRFKKLSCYPGLSSIAHITMGAPAMDIRGLSISPGDTVAYPVRHGSHMRMVVAVVIEAHPDLIVCQVPGGKKRSTVTRLDRVVRVS